MTQTAARRVTSKAESGWQSRSSSRLPARQPRPESAGPGEPETESESAGSESESVRQHPLTVTPGPGPPSRPRRRGSTVTDSESRPGTRRLRVGGAWQALRTRELPVGSCKDRVN